MWTALLLLVGVTTDLVVESSEGLAPELSTALQTDLASAIARTTGAPCRIGEQGGEDRVGLSLFGAVTRVRILAVRRGSPAIQVDVPTEPDAWGADLDDLARRLYVGASLVQKPAELLPTSDRAVPKETSIAGWITLGAGTTVLAVGIGFLVASLGVRGGLDEPGLGTSDVEARFDQERVFVGIGTGAVVGGAGLLIAGLFVE